jgi:hypothetical protein
MNVIEYPRAGVTEFVYCGVMKPSYDENWHAPRTCPKLGTSFGYDRVSFKKANAILLAINEGRDLTVEEEKF